MKFFSATFVLLALLFLVNNVSVGSAGRQPEEYWGAAMGGEAMPAIISKEVAGAWPFDTAANVIIYHAKQFLKIFDTAPNVILYHSKNQPGESAIQKN